jgi:hypothetical protein
MIFAVSLILFTAFALILLLKSFIFRNEYAVLLNMRNFFARKNKSIKLLKDINGALRFGLPFLSKYLGEDSTFKFTVLSFLLIILCSFCAGPFLTDACLGPMLGLLIASAYIMRIFFHLSLSFRIKLLGQLERILLSIRNYLSTGMTLDYSVYETAKHNQEAPLGPNLLRFIKVADSNFVEKFPAWLKSVRKLYRIQELSESAQLLSLELAYTNNQEQSFLNAASAAVARNKANKQQRNILSISFFTLDFIVFCFLGTLFFIIPEFNSGDAAWWNSPERTKVVFLTSALIWGLYAASILIALRRRL